MSFGNVIGGALMGVGAGLAQMQKNKSDAVAADLADRREQALIKMRGDVTMGINDQQGQITRANTTAEYNLRDRNDATSAVRDTQKAVIVEGQKQKGQISLEQLRASNDAGLARLKSRLNMTENQAKAAQDLANDATLAGQQVGETRVAVDGSMVLYSKDGKVLRRSGAGMFKPDGPREKDEDSSAVERARGGAAPAAATAKPATAPAQVKQPAAAGKTYTMADAKATAEARGISVAEVQKVMKANGYKLTGN